MDTKLTRDDLPAAILRLPDGSWIAIVSVILLALMSGCGNTSDSKQDTATLPTMPVSSTSASERMAETPQDVVEKTVAAETVNAAASEETPPEEPLPDAEQVRMSRLLHDADQASSAFKVIGPHTKHFVALYQFFEAAGWNDFIDGLTMKSCPDGYEFFCQTRGIFVEIYEETGGDVDLLVQLARNMDLRDHFYRLASAADIYQVQRQAVVGQAPNK